MSQGTSGGSLIGRIGSYLQIVTKDPRSTAFVPLAEAYRQVGLLDDALEAARLGTRMLPHFCPGFATMGRILGQMGRIDEAMSAYAKALSIDRQSQAALVGLARLHLIRAERDQARKILRQAAEFHPDDEAIKNMLNALDLPRPWADLQQSAESQETSAEQIAEEAEESAPIPTATLAEIYVKQGLTDKAIGVYRDILSQDPTNESARERLAELSQEATSVEAVIVEKQNIGQVDTSQVEQTPTAAIEDSVVSEAQKQSETIEKRSPLAVLERWLNVIKQGKANV